MTISFGEIAQFLTALSALTAVFMSWRNGHKINTVHVEMNGRLNEFLETKRAEGFLAGRQRERISPGTDETT